LIATRHGRDSADEVAKGAREGHARRHLAGFEEKNRHLAEVEVDEVLRLVRNVGAEIATHDAMPSGVVFLVKLLLDVAGDVLLDVVLLQGLRRAVHGILHATS